MLIQNCNASDSPTLLFNRFCVGVLRSVTSHIVQKYTSLHTTHAALDPTVMPNCTDALNSVTQPLAQDCLSTTRQQSDNSSVYLIYAYKSKVWNTSYHPVGGNKTRQKLTNEEN